MKSFLKRLIPPLILDVYRKIRPKYGLKDENIWKGDYKNWDDALRNSAGYNDTTILQKTKDAILKVKSGEAKYERDSMLFEEVAYSWPLLASLQIVAIENNLQLNVLDFGGSLGTTYLQNINIFSRHIDVNWRIVEQESWVQEGKQIFKDHELRFYQNIEEAMENGKIDCLLLASVLPYLQDPYFWIEKFISKKFNYILIDRTSFINNEDRLTVQQVPASIYNSSYPCWFFNIDKFKTKFTQRYELIAEFDDSFTSQINLDGYNAYWKGFLFKLKIDDK